MPSGEIDLSLYLLAEKNNFEGPEYQEIEETLFKYGFRVMIGMIRNGSVVEQAMRLGARGVHIPPGAWRAEIAADAEDIAIETVHLALQKFQQRAQTGRGWNPHGGASLTTYFVGQCLFAFADAYRDWRHARERWTRGSTVRPSNEVIGAGPDEVVIAMEEMTLRLSSGSLAERALFLGAAGYTQTEVAEIVGVTSRALRYRLERHRQKTRKTPEKK